MTVARPETLNQDWRTNRRPLTQPKKNRRKTTEDRPKSRPVLVVELKLKGNARQRKVEKRKRWARHRTWITLPQILGPSPKRPNCVSPGRFWAPSKLHSSKWMRFSIGDAWVDIDPKEKCCCFGFHCKQAQPKLTLKQTTHTHTHTRKRDKFQEF